MENKSHLWNHQALRFFRLVVFPCWFSSSHSRRCLFVPEFPANGTTEPLYKDTSKRVPEKNQVPSGKLLQNYGKSPFLMGKSTINGPFSIAMLTLPEGILWQIGWFLAGSHHRWAKSWLEIGPSCDRLPNEKKPWTPGKSVEQRKSNRCTLVNIQKNIEHGHL